MKRTNCASRWGAMGLAMLSLAMVVVLISPSISLAATHMVLAENGSATW